MLNHIVKSTADQITLECGGCIVTFLGIVLILLLLSIKRGKL